MFNSFSVTGSSLALLKAGEKGIIQFCNSQDEKILNQVISLGLIPGAYITLEQRFPNFVLKVEHQSLVIDKVIARTLYVRVVNR
ncbi:MAG: ferrous iron transport protein A [Fischerella sp.]|jgi:ferrous iron transport protein A|uniref:FeoA family protein n=1 Tax=Fischerella sp. TaxID=1191 RepID=UPI0017E6C304|nr:FeoA family protein [Fischerella sp.]NWF60372.1 ferrous iron transport protein A [Fischerella sp.]